MKATGQKASAPDGHPAGSGPGRLRVALDVRSVRSHREGIGNYALALAEGLAELLGTRERGEGLGPEPALRQADAGSPDPQPEIDIWMLGDRHTDWDALPAFPHRSGPDGPLWHAWAAVTAGRIADVYHSTGSYFAPLLTATPVVLTVHDIVALRHPTTQSRWTRLTQGALGLALRKARVVLAVSTFTAREVASEFPGVAGKIHPVLHAARRLESLGRVEAASRDRLEAPWMYEPSLLGQARRSSELPAPGAGEAPPDLPPDLPLAFILAVGSLEPRKNLVTLLRAHARMAAPPPLVLVGHRRWRGAELDRALADHPHAVRILTDVPDAQLAWLYATCSVFAFPSRYEGFGLPVLEAMSCGAPVVASRASAIPEAAGDAALLFDPDDPGELASLLGRVLADPGLRAELVERGRVRAAGRSWTDVARETVKLYERATMSP